MERHKRLVVCSENEALAEYMLSKWQEMADKKPKGISENIEKTLTKAYSNVCNSKNPVKTLKEFSQIKGVGKWILKLMQGYFDTGSGSSEPEDVTKKGKRTKGSKRYVPQKNSVAYALLITLYRGTESGNEFMRKQELIDAAEASGLSRVPIMPEKGKGIPVHLGNSTREWYSGWSCMKTLITKGLVVKSSCPAKYMLTQEGKEAARECLVRSGLADPVEIISNARELSIGDVDISHQELSSPDSATDMTLLSCNSSRNKNSIDIPQEYLDKFTRMGYSEEQMNRAISEVLETSHNKEISSLWPSVLCRLREDEVYGFHMKSQSIRGNLRATPSTHTLVNGDRDCVRLPNTSRDGGPTPRINSDKVASKLFTTGAPSSPSCPVPKSSLAGVEASSKALSVPPLSFGEKFEDAYELVFVLDDREQLAAQISRSRSIIESVISGCKITVEVRRLPVGDGIWIARHKHLKSEYVLDFIVERKNVDDLRCSIRDNRYRDQKLRLLRCGLKKLIYLVEGDPNSSEAAESIKTACFTTELLEGFDVQRTGNLTETLRKYGYLTEAIFKYYKDLSEEQHKQAGVCPPFDEFNKRCQDLDKMTVSDVFAIQLMQVPQVTEEVAIAVLDLYPTVISLAREYSLLEGDVGAQEEMLRTQSNNVVNAAASKNIFHFVWGID
ncbi:putative ERCC4 domain, restriction endonuclease type II [Rosa chinensis]|uniref:Crossover junction endonuclease MUS81 n=1 Tax=Rosa chinensis TaxID=74649 RepID=A0A2P6S8H1_ROSCH|nr:crossover junction endonuclease MUS81 [Rosa chinensis]PRQ54978.1 putative ERCC4 domain, restriction endonuclease type II [Rosa chinensis]